MLCCPCACTLRSSAPHDPACAHALAPFLASAHNQHPTSHRLPACPPASRPPSLQDFGKYGYIREADMHAKQNEFVVWATEVKGANVELMGRAEEKELFREYMEDYNTGTLPHK